MKINRLALPNNKKMTFEEEVDFSSYPGDKYHIRRIEKCLVKLEACQYDDLLTLTFNIKGMVISSCAYTLEDIPYPINIHETINVTGEDDDEFIFDSDILDLDNVILTLIVSSVPMKLVKEGAKLPQDGDGYRFIKEGEENKEKKPSPFDILDDLE